ncbi:MFS general substrate transporter [Coprinopsis marcescibilis]|uniref:MFS general substrate transporter n=1 Tax=Coprinopsis marcescibilis TaxID=230819 RepID=A0A5C3KQT0_COPMA|nr:MFS general substrate transporter [Coprinopsis marcescibilis]
MSFASVTDLEASTTSSQVSHDISKRDQWRSFSCVLGASIALFCAFGQMNAFGTYHSWYSRHQLSHLSPSKISWIGSLQLWIFFFSGGFIGRVFDSYGPKLLMFAGSGLYAVSVVATSLSTQYYEYMLSQGLLFGLATGLLQVASPYEFYPSLASVSTHFTTYRATALGIAAAGSSLGGVLYPIILQHLFHLLGYGWGVRITGLISTLGCLVATILVTTKLPPQEQSGHFFQWKSIVDIRFAFLIVGSCFVALGLFTPFFYIVEFARHLSIPDRMALYILAVMNAGGVLGRIAPAYLSDRVGRFNLLFPSAFFSGLACLVGWFFARSIAVLMVFSAIYGFFSGAFVSLITPCVAQISDLSEIGTRIGILYTVISFPSLIGGPTAGVLLGLEHGSYTGMIAFSGSTVMLGSLFILLSKLAIDRRVLARV